MTTALTIIQIISALAAMMPAQAPMQPEPRTVSVKHSGEDIFRPFREADESLKPYFEEMEKKHYGR